MTLSATTVPSANTERLNTETPAADVHHHLTVFAEGDDSPSFKDFLDIINPLQHIPIINTIYREVTGDEPGALARVAGGALYGGILGMALEAADTAIADTTGKDVGEHVWAFLTGDDGPPGGDNGAKVAQGTPTPEQPAGTSPATETSVAASSSAEAPLTAAESMASAQPPAPIAPGPQPLVTKQGLAPLGATAQTPPQNADAKNTNSQTTETQTAQAPVPIKIAAALPHTVARPSSVQTAAVTNPANGNPLPPGYMPIPTRRAANLAPTTFVTAPVTTSSQNSNVPITGRPRPMANLARDAAIPPVSTPTPPPADAQTTLTAQQIALQNQPLPPSSSPSNQWFPSAMAKALDKYEQMNKLGRASAAQTASAPVPAPANDSGLAPLTALP
jgi:hypothetical protein